MSMLKVHFSQTRASTFEGTEFRIAGGLSLEAGAATELVGPNGSGKTTILAVLAHLFQSYAFRLIASLDEESITLILPKAIADISVSELRLYPEKNILGKCVADEFSVSYRQTRLSAAEFDRLWREIWITEFGLSTELLSRRPETLSSGEQQLLAIGSRAVVSSDLLLADEPFSRLSRARAERARRVLCNLRQDAYTVITGHSPQIPPSRAVTFDGDTINISEVVSCILPLGEPVGRVSASELYINTEEFAAELERTANFNHLPGDSVHFVGGNGAVVFEDVESVEIFNSRNHRRLTSCGRVVVREGINLLIGDNGAGKTLIGRVLTRDIPTNPWLPILHTIMARVMFTQDEVSSQYSFKSRGRFSSFFLTSYPREMLDEHATVEKELQRVFPELSDRTSRSEWLSCFGIKSSDRIDSLSFGQGKLVSIAILPFQFDLVVLDEPFANLSVETSTAVAGYILERVASREWRSVVITANRPDLTISTLWSARQRQFGGHVDG